LCFWLSDADAKKQPPNESCPGNQWEAMNRDR
jgi:hypothetical protein